MSYNESFLLFSERAIKKRSKRPIAEPTVIIEICKLTITIFVYDMGS